LQTLRPQDVAGRLAVAIDVLRASSTIVTALDAGAREIRVAATPREARARYERLRAAKGCGDGLLLGGERLGLRIEGFDLGNSPMEYTPWVVSGRIIFFCTTNGTRTLKRAAGRGRDEAGAAREVMVAAFLNARAVAERLWASEGSVVMACAGTRGGFSLEDILLAGMLVTELENKSISEPPADPTAGGFVFRDLARAAAVLYRSMAGHDGEGLTRAIVRTDHARHLSSIGFADDVAYCSSLNVTDLVPVYAAGRVTAAGPVSGGRAPFCSLVRPQNGQKAR